MANIDKSGGARHVGVKGSEGNVEDHANIYSHTGRREQKEIVLAFVRSLTPYDACSMWPTNGFLPLGFRTMAFVRS